MSQVRKSRGSNCWERAMNRSAAKRWQIGLRLGLLIALVPAANLAAPPDSTALAASSGRPAGVAGTVVVPDKFLRS